jgi:predicted transcriptional regulator of viral defense system
MRHEPFFLKHAVFTGEDFARHLEKAGRKPGQTVGNVGVKESLIGFNNSVGKGRRKESLLAYHLKAGRIVRVRRDLYATVPKGESPAQFLVDPYLIASKLAEGAVLSHHTALDLHGRAYSFTGRLTYLAWKPTRPLVFQSNRFLGTKFPKALMDAGQELVGTKVLDRQGQSVLVTTLERTLVDALDRPDLSGGWEEVWRSLESVEYFDLDRVVEYALLLDNATVAAKVGFFLDKRRDALFVTEDHLVPLRSRRPKQPHYLERSRREGRLVKAWNLVVPVNVLGETWGEIL